MSDKAEPSGSSAWAGLDRKAMEEARLARLAKKRGPSEQLDAQVEHPPEKRARDESPICVEYPPLYLPLAKRSRSPDNATATSDLEYPFGAFKKTWCLGFPREDDVKIEEVLQKNTLKVAVMSSWQIDFDWLSSKLDLARTKMILVMQSKDEAEKDKWRKQAKSWSKSIRLCFPAMGGGYSTMHQKLMLLFHPEHLRIVVPSANLVRFDWGETGHMENMVFLLDLPRLSLDCQGSAKNPTMTPFTSDLLYFLRAMEIDGSLPDKADAVTEAVLKFDFTHTAHLGFVHTIPGAHLGASARKTGYPQMSDVVRMWGNPGESEEDLQVDFAASSIGALTETRLHCIYDALRGQVKPPSGPPSQDKAASVNKTPERPAMSSHLNVYYPSRETVESSKGGINSAGTLFMSPTFDKPTSSGPFPVASLRDSISNRMGLLSHVKMIVARGEKHALVYVGSANFSPSAWGTLTWDKKKKQPKLSANNWECGVIMRVGYDESSVRPKSGQGITDLGRLVDLRGKKIPIPFKVPGEPYVDSVGKVKRPWIQHFSN